MNFSKEKSISYTFNVHRLPLEVRLEIFGFLIYKQWIRLAKHNRRTKRVLLSHQRYRLSGTADYSISRALDCIFYGWNIYFKYCFCLQNEAFLCKNFRFLKQFFCQLLSVTFMVTFAWHFLLQKKIYKTSLFSKYRSKMQKRSHIFSIFAPIWYNLYQVLLNYYYIWLIIIAINYTVHFDFY
jgi:hypothetical protein